MLTLILFTLFLRYQTIESAFTYGGILSAPDASENSYFGSGVAMYDTHAIVGAFRESTLSTHQGINIFCYK